MLNSHHPQFSLKMMRDETSLGDDENEQRVPALGARQRSEQAAAEVVEVMIERGGRVISHCEYSGWAVDGWWIDGGWVISGATWMGSGRPVDCCWMGGGWSVDR